MTKLLVQYAIAMAAVFALAGVLQLDQATGNRSGHALKTASDALQKRICDNPGCAAAGDAAQ